MELLISFVNDAIKFIAGYQRDHRQMADEALRAVSEALTETCLYYERIDAGVPRDRDVEEELARLWAAAAVPLRNLDMHLATTCQYKSEYWINPDNWRARTPVGRRIELNAVRREFRAAAGLDSA